MKKILIIIVSFLCLTAQSLAVTLYEALNETYNNNKQLNAERENICLLYTSPSPRDREKSRMPSSA